MKRNTFLSCLTLVLLSVSTKFIGQVTYMNDLQTVVSKTIQDVQLENKILFINVWKSSDFESRQNTKEFFKIAKIYEYGKLSHGSKGVCFINISLDNNITEWQIAIKKDSIHNKYNLENTSGAYTEILKYFENKPGSILLGSNGELLKRNLTKENCFETFKSYITR